MLSQVTAVRFIKVMGSGRTRPILVEAERADGSLCEVVAKLSAGECHVSGLVREAFASMLAADLGLPVPEPFLVHFPVAFSATLPDQHSDLRIRLSNSVDPTFGCIFVRSVNLYIPGSALPAKLLTTASEIVAFDGICRNVDRHATKPNCLTDNESVLVMIDHELALGSLDTVGSFIDPYPWQIGGMESMLLGDHQHILLRAVKGKGVDLDRLEAAWTGIQPSRLAEYAVAMPATWHEGNIVSDTQAYLALTLSNLQSAFVEARRVAS